jgi:hypothetical protein
MQNEELSEGIRIVLKFSQETQIFLSEGKFVSSEGKDISYLNDCLSREPDVEVHSLFDLSSETNQVSSIGEQFPDLSRYYSIVVKGIDRAERLRNELDKMSFVEEAYIEPLTHLAV